MRDVAGALLLVCYLVALYTAPLVVPASVLNTWWAAITALVVLGVILWVANPPWVP